MLCLLLAAQSLSLAHELDHMGLGEASLCAVCSVSHGLDTPAYADDAIPESGPARITAESQPAPVRVHRSAAPATARAPPAT